MSTAGIEVRSINTGQGIFGVRCPECGNKMVEAERANENGSIFVWYECTRAGCSGQWLEKRVFGSSASGTSTTRAAHIVGVQ